MSLMGDCKYMSKNILVLTNNIGGLHSFRKEVIKAIVDSGYNVFISEPDDDERVKYFEEIGCHIIKTVFNRRGMNPIADFLLMLRYRKMINHLKPVVVLSYTIKPNVYGGMACVITNTPQIANVTGLGDAVENGGWLQKLTIFLYRIGISRAKQVFFQNKNNQETCLRLRISDERSIVLPGSGVNLQHHVYQKYPGNGTIKFLFIARLLKDKGTDEYFEMAKTIKARYLQTEFQILGGIEGAYLQKLNEFVSRGIIKHLGTTSDVRPYLAQAHCTIMPSYHEGMSNVNLESAANGRPVITTDVPGCKETVDDGITGIIVKPKNVQDLIDGVERFLNFSYEKKRQMGIEGRKKVEREFDRNIVIKTYLDAIRDLN